MFKQTVHSHWTSAQLDFMGLILHKIKNVLVQNKSYTLNVIMLMITVIKKTPCIRWKYAKAQ